MTRWYCDIKLSTLVATAAALALMSEAWTDTSCNRLIESASAAYSYRSDVMRDELAKFAVDGLPLSDDPRPFAAAAAAAPLVLLPPRAAAT